MSQTNLGGGLEAERVARNDAIFREANERIEAKAEELDILRAPFICECAEESCTETVLLQLEEYEAIRADPRHFLNISGHQASAGPHVRVVEEQDGYIVVEKIGKAGEIVVELDTRERSGPPPRRG